MQIRGGISTFKTRFPHAYELMVIAPKVVMNLIRANVIMHPRVLTEVKRTAPLSRRFVSHEEASRIKSHAWILHIR